MSFFTKVKRILVGKPIHTKHAHHERLPVVYGLPVFASDALSSVAYASEEILLILVTAGVAALPYLVSVSWWLGGLMLIIGFSYYQTIHAYPQGGGTYLVSTQNLGSFAGRTAGASLLIDYVLTVAVSVSSGVSALISMAPATQQYAVPIGCGAVAVLCIANLRGAKESGIIFAIPTYAFVVLVMALVIMGLIHGVGQPGKPVDPAQLPVTHGITAFLLLRAFAASCTALTGTEAIADGVQAFRPPEARNAALTLVLMVGILLSMFLGLSWMAFHYGIVPKHPGEAGYQTVVAQLAISQFGQGWFFYALQIATALILFLAANTAFADFPRLSSFIARDGFLPRQLMSIGDRLVFQNGILLLAGSAIALIVVYHADTHSLIPLYAMGVFISFTLSQSGMVARAFRLEQGKAFGDWKMYVSLVGAITTAIVTFILLITKFSEGAWLIVVALAIMLLIFSRIKRHYNYLAEELRVPESESIEKVKTTALLLVPRVHRGVLHAIAYAQSMTKDVRALHVTLDKASAETIKSEWDKHKVAMPLVILESPYRSLIEPVIEYIDQALAEEPNTMITVIVPQAVPKRFWHGILHNNAAVALKLALSSRKNVVVTNVRYFLS